MADEAAVLELVTMYYFDSRLSGPDDDLLAAFNSGNPVYVYVLESEGDVCLN